jgi:hypothetical protein
VSRGARFWGFRCSRVRGALHGIYLIPLNLASTGGQNLGYGLSMRCSYYPQSLAQIRRAIWEIGSWILGELTRRCCSSREPRPHRSDRCRPKLGFAVIWRSSRRLRGFGDFSLTLGRIQPLSGIKHLPAACSNLCCYETYCLEDRAIPRTFLATVPIRGLRVRSTPPHMVYKLRKELYGLK